MNSEKRRNIGILGSFIVHLLVFLLIAFTGLFQISHAREDIVEVAIFGGGGGGGSGAEEPAAGVQEEEEPTAPETQETTTEPDPEPQDAIIHSDKKQENVAPKPAAAKPKSKGYGTGQGSGRGSGIGPGSGSGSGGGHGSGHGTGTGSGIGPGNGIAANPAIPPRILRSSQPSYPAAERSANIEGTTIIRFLIAKDGSIEDITVVKSSGNSNLDAAAVAACRKWRFSGAKGKSGQPVRCYANIPITFRLK